MVRLITRLQDTRLTISDVVYLAIKIGLVIGLCLQVGVLLGIIAFILLNYLVDLFIRIIYVLQPLNTTDKNVFYDQVSNRCNIMAAVIFEKCETEAIREII